MNNLLDIHSHESSLIVTGGWSGYQILGDTEIFVESLSNKTSSRLARCRSRQNPTQTMHALNEATGQLLRITNQTENSTSFNYIPVICGGRTAKKDSEVCYNLDGDLLQPRLFAQMATARRSAASVAIFNATTLWITGGIGLSSIVTDTSEWINVSKEMSTNTTGKFSKGPSLPKPMFSHCLEFFNGESAILFGGLQVDQKPILETWILDNLTDLSMMDRRNKNQWTMVAAMEFERYAMSCGVVRQDVSDDNNPGIFVVAAGGIDQKNQITNVVELFQVNDGWRKKSTSRLWTGGPNLPINLAKAASAATEDRSMLFMAGGIEDHHLAPSSIILAVGCWDGLCEWIKYNTELIHARVSSVAFVFSSEIPVDVAKSKYKDTFKKNNSNSP